MLIDPWALSPNPELYHPKNNTCPNLEDRVTGK